MCLPCFPWTWTQYEDPLDSMPEQSVWTHNGNSWQLQRVQPVGAVPMVYGQPGYIHTQQQLGYFPQPVAGQQQPIMINGQPYVSAQPHPMQGMPAPAMGGPSVAVGGAPFIAGNSGNPPEVAGLGRTPGEETIRQLEFAYSNRLFEAQDFKPADDDNSRFYWVREVDGNWTQRNRFTIDRLGKCRWYAADAGWFYAVRLPD